MLTAEELDHALYLLLHLDDTNVLLGWEILRGHPDCFSSIRLPLLLLSQLDAPLKLEDELAACVQPLFTSEEWTAWELALQLLQEPYFEHVKDVDNALKLHETKRPLLEPIFKRSARLALLYFPIASSLYDWEVAPVLIQTYLSILLEAIPNHAPSLSLMGEWSLTHLKAPLIAQQWFGKALKSAPSCARYHYLMGQLHLEYLAGDPDSYQTSIDFLRQAHQLDPTEPTYGYAWAKGLYRAKQKENLDHALSTLQPQLGYHPEGLLWAGCYFLYEKNDLEAVRFYYDQLNGTLTVENYPDIFAFLGVCEIRLKNNIDHAAYLFHCICHTDKVPSLSTRIIAFTHLVLDCDAHYNADMIYDEYDLGKVSNETLTKTVLPYQKVAFRKAQEQFLNTTYQF